MGMAIGRLAISTADSAKMRRRRGWAGSNPQAAKLSNWMVRAEKGESPGKVGVGEWRGTGFLEITQ